MSREFADLRSIVVYMPHPYHRDNYFNSTGV